KERNTRKPEGIQARSSPPCAPRARGGAADETDRRTEARVLHSLREPRRLWRTDRGARRRLVAHAEDQTAAPADGRCLRPPAPSRSPIPPRTTSPAARSTRRN